MTDTERIARNAARLYNMKHPTDRCILCRFDQDQTAHLLGCLAGRRGDD